VDHKKVVKVVKDVLGPKAYEIISSKPLAYFAESPAIMYRKKGESLHVCTLAMDEGYLIGLHDKEEKLVQDISNQQKTQRSLKRKRCEEEARRIEENNNKKSKTGDEESTGPVGEHIKKFTLEECCAIYSDHEFANEMGVLNKGIQVRLDLCSMRTESLRMVFPLKC